MGMAVMGEIGVLQRYIGKMSDPDVILRPEEKVCVPRDPLDADGGA